MKEAIQREKSLKKWKRAWKLALIEKHNPEWRPVCPETGVLLAFENEVPTWEDPSKSR